MARQSTDPLKSFLIGPQKREGEISGRQILNIVGLIILAGIVILACAGLV